SRRSHRRKLRTRSVCLNCLVSSVLLFECLPSHPSGITPLISTPIIKSLLESLQFRRSRSWLVRSHSANNDWSRHGQSYTSKSCSPTGIFSIRDAALRESHLCSSLRL